MSKNEVLHVEVRDSQGSRAAKRLRAEGKTPVVLYGHGEGTVSLSIPSKEIDALLRHGSLVVELQGAATGPAIVKDVQWDGLGNEVLHLDFARVSVSERVEVTVPVELRGVAPGSRNGGIVQQPIHEIELTCSVAQVPEKIQVNVNDLELNGQITVAELELPEGATTSHEPNEVVVQCVEPMEAPEEVAGAEGAEPEVIGRAEGEASEESED